MKPSSSRTLPTSVTPAQLCTPVWSLRVSAETSPWADVPYRRNSARSKPAFWSHVRSFRDDGLKARIAEYVFGTLTLTSCGGRVT